MSKIKVREGGWLAKQINEAQVDIATWPEYMRSEFPLETFSTDVLKRAITVLKAKILDLEYEISKREKP